MIYFKPLPMLLMTLMFVTACSKPTSYYTSPNSAGYNQRALGAVCEHCGKTMQISGNQLQNVPQIKCPYCSHLSNTRNASARWVPVKNQRNQQANQQMILGIMQGAATGLNSYNSNHSTPTTYQSSGCSSDFDCGIGNKCVKEQFKSRGTCMKSVDEYGVQSFEMPNSSSIGVNTDSQCTFDTDCPVGFRCDTKYKACVK